jgi:hydroxymethylpyrimidine pyrophosphatase-like HAD family hydrolase
MFSVVGDAARDRAAPSYSGLPFVELAARHVTKALALAALADQLTLSAHQVVAIGDNHNDIPMLEWAGVGLAMANATDDAKKAADRTIGSNDEDGLAHAINDLLDLMAP